MPKRDHQSTPHSPGSFTPGRHALETKRVDDLQVLTRLEQVMGVVFDALKDINLIQGHQNIAPVEDIEERLKENHKKIEEYLRKIDEPEASQEASLAMGGPGGAGGRSSVDAAISLEEHPLLPKQGGMPIEQISPEWRQEAEGVANLQDKAELQNQLKNKLKNKLAFAMGQVKELQAKLVNKPKMQPMNDLILKYKETLDLKVKPILQEVPELTPAPRRQIEPPRPPGVS